MIERVPRFMLAVAGIVAFAVIFVAVRDYVQQRREVRSPASATATAAVESKEASAAKKTISGKARRPQSSAFRSNASRAAQDAADDTGNPLSPTLAGSSLLVVNGTAASSLGGAQDAEQATEAPATEDAGIGRNNRTRGVPNNKMTQPGVSSAQCVPLPNGTDPADVDAHYYTNWAREYSCQI